MFEELGDGQIKKLKEFLILFLESAFGVYLSCIPCLILQEYEKLLGFLSETHP